MFYVTNKLFKNKKRMEKNIFFFILFFFVSLIANAQLNGNGDFEITNFNDGNIRLVGWKYMPDDNPEYANPNYDDSDWLQLTTREDFYKFMKKDFNGFGWFRLKIILPDSLKNEVFSINIVQAGGLSVYANGKFLESFGQPSINKDTEKVVYTDTSPFVANFQSDTVVLAIKYSLQKKSLITNSVKFNIY